MANFKGHSEIDLINMFGVILRYNNVRSDNSAKIEQNKPSPDFLFNVFNLF